MATEIRTIPCERSVKALQMGEGAVGYAFASYVHQYVPIIQRANAFIQDPFKGRSGSARDVEPSRDFLINQELSAIGAEARPVIDHWHGVVMVEAEHGGYLSIVKTEMEAIEKALRLLIVSVAHSQSPHDALWHLRETVMRSEGHVWAAIDASPAKPAGAVTGLTVGAPLLRLLKDQPDQRMALVDVPVDLLNEHVVTVMDADGLIEFGTRNHCHAGGELRVERGWDFVSVTGPHKKPVADFLAEALGRVEDERIRIHVQLTPKGRVEASRLALAAQSAKERPKLWQPVDLDGDVDAATIDAVRNVVRDWDGKNWPTVRAVLEADGLSEERIRTITLQDIRQIFTVRQKPILLKIGGQLETATNTLLSVSKRPRKPSVPSDKAFMAWRLQKLRGIGKQEEIAAVMSKELKEPVNQGSVSRWLEAVEEFLNAGGTMPPLPDSATRPVTVDPAVIDQGARRDRRSRSIRKSEQD